MKSIWLSHIISEKTSLYGGTGSIATTKEKSISAGDSCNTSILTLTSHTGTHVDSPYHFLANGKSVEQYLPKDWIFHHPHVIFFSVSPGQLIVSKNLSLPENIDKSTDMLLLHSGFEEHRGFDLYWQEGPGLSPELAEYFVERFPKLRAVGMDFISISSLKHREAGRAAHKAFLERGILLFEDMSLNAIGHNSRLEKVIALPLRFAKADGAPCTIVGEVVE